MTSFREKLIVVAGPTASGKTDYAIKLAKKLDGEIVNADSRQVYKYMSIGTNKGRLVVKSEKLKVKSERLKVKSGKIELCSYELEDSGVIGWLFDLVTPDQEFNLSDYQELADEVISDINSRGKTAILVGGSGLYIDAVVNNYSIVVPPDSELREQLEKLPVTELQQKVQELDPKFFADINNSEKNNPRRLIRMIEKLTSGKTPKRAKRTKRQYELIYLDLPKAELYKRIDNRAETMFKQGFVDEVNNLIKPGYKDTKPLQGMGYKQVVDYLDGKITLEECIEKTKQAHRNYAKRQMTWFKRSSQKAP